MRTGCGLEPEVDDEGKSGEGRCRNGGLGQQFQDHGWGRRERERGSIEVRESERRGNTFLGWILGSSSRRRHLSRIRCRLYRNDGRQRRGNGAGGGKLEAERGRRRYEETSSSLTWPYLQWCRETKCHQSSKIMTSLIFWLFRARGRPDFQDCCCLESTHLYPTLTALPYRRRSHHSFRLLAKSMSTTRWNPNRRQGVAGEWQAVGDPLSLRP